MHRVEERASWEAIARMARRRASRRIKRLDILIASILLLLLLFGWVKDLAKAELWPGGGLVTASHGGHALSSDRALR